MPNPGSHNAIIAFSLDFLELSIGIHAAGDQLTAIDFLPPSTQCRSADNSTAQLVADQLTEYFHDSRFQFDLPSGMQGTGFQLRVWQALSAIPPGEVRSYGDIAEVLGSSARAVGNACRANPVPIVVPCHRVVSRQGLGGYCGRTGGTELRVKQWLLAHERG